MINIDNLSILYEYLLTDDILSYEDKIFCLIPELKYEKGFEQKNEWHCYDVWKHTIATINACDKEPENRLIMLLHDIGKPFSYQDENEIRHFKNHASKSKEMAEIILDRFDIPLENKEKILKLIELHSTRIVIEDIDDIDFYKRLLKIQKYDAQGYEKVHSLKVMEQLNIIEKEMNKLYMKNNDVLER